METRVSVFTVVAITIALFEGHPLSAQVASDPDSEPVSFEELFRVGSIDGPPETQFTSSVSSVVQIDGGVILTLDFFAGEVSAFDSTGRFLRRFGRLGQGPGEFSAPHAIAWDSAQGEVWIADYQNRRYSVFAADGQYLRSHPRDLEGGVSKRQSPLLVREGVTTDHVARGGRVSIFDGSADVLSRQLELILPPNPFSGIIAATRDEEWIELARSFRPKLVWTLAPDGTIWSAHSNSNRLINQSASGDTLGVIELSHRSVAFSESEERAVRRLSPLYDERGFTPILIQSLHASNDGKVLVQIAAELGEAGREFDLIDTRSGRVIGSVMLPVPLDPLGESEFRGDRFTYFGTGELDVPILVSGQVVVRD